MHSYSKNDVVLVRYPFTNATGAKVRPAVVVNAENPSDDLFIVPLTSRTYALLPGEFVPQDWGDAGLRIATAVKRGITTVESSLVLKRVGALSRHDGEALDVSLRLWMALG